MEILAPCGSPEHVKAAVYAGADAIYLGGYGFSARRNAINFSLDEIREAARFCRGFGVKVYITVNTLVRNNEWNSLSAYLKELALVSPDALIVQDIGVARFCRSILPEIPLHASTQLSVHTAEGVRFCEEAGFSRVVIARELDRDALAGLCANSRIGIEVFVHGALCVSVSGQCLLSAVIGGRSGNRGLCAQPCRLDFSESESKQHYALSLKDLSLVREAAELEHIGVCSLKIEGRMKRPEYVAAAVRAVRESLAGEEPRLDELQAVFSRGGFTQGYFYNRPENMGGIRSREDVDKTTAVLPSLNNLTRSSARLVPISMDFNMRTGHECVLTLSDGLDKVSVRGSVPEPAVSRAVNDDEVHKLLSRLGGMPFCAAEIRTYIDYGLAMPVSKINALRREACGKLLELRILRRTPKYTFDYNALTTADANLSRTASKRNTTLLRVHCRTLEQALSLSDSSVEQLVLDINSVEMSPEIISDRLIVAPDRFITNENALKRRLSTLKDKGARNLLCQNPAHVVTGRELGYRLHGGFGLNIFNNLSADYWVEAGLCDLTASVELRLAEALGLNTGVPVGLVVYGRLPLMLLRRCPFGRVCEKGKACPGKLTDRTSRCFPVDCSGGYQELLNSETLWMADRLPELRNPGFLSLLLHNESADELQTLVRAFRKGAPPPNAYTRGLFTRGVE